MVFVGLGVINLDVTAERSKYGCVIGALGVICPHRDLGWVLTQILMVAVAEVLRFKFANFYNSASLQ